jgi:hypothetical protein
VAEFLHPWRGREIGGRHLTRAGRPLAAVAIGWSGSEPDIVDLCDPDVLVRLGVSPDQIASRHRAVTQPIAKRAWAAGAEGLRWWSRFWGDWHTVVLFARRAGGDTRGMGLALGRPQPLGLDSPAVVDATRLLGISRSA